MRNSALFIVPPCVPVASLLPNKEVTFSAKIKKEVPLGALSLATYVKRKCAIRVKVLDLNVVFYDLLETEAITDIDLVEGMISAEIQSSGDEWGFIGISAVFSPAYDYIKIISNACRKIFPSALICAGGGVPTNMPDNVFHDSPNVDLISFGEGELGIAGLIQTKDEAEFIANSPSLITREKLSEGTRPDFEFIENLDDIPPLDFSLISLTHYNSHAHSQDGTVPVAIPLMFSRGCPFRCCFCASHSVHGRKVRYNSLNRIKQEVKDSVEKYDVNTITVWDDNFFVDKEQALELLNFFRDLKLTVEFVNGFPVYQMSEEMAESLLRSGVETVTLAIESGNPRVLRDIIHKPLKLEMVPKAIEILRKYDFYVKGLFVIGFPGETMEDIQITMDFIQSSGLNWADIFIATPLPGSELLEKSIEGGYIDQEKLTGLSYWEGSIETEYFTIAQIEDIQQYNMMLKDYVNNLDMREHKWERALSNFEYVIKAKHENPFAYYYAAKAAKELGMDLKAIDYFNRQERIMLQNEKWRILRNRFEKEGIDFASSFEDL